MTAVDESNRESMMDVIESLTLNSYTCLGAAVKKGISVSLKYEKNVFSA